MLSYLTDKMWFFPHRTKVTVSMFYESNIFDHFREGSEFSVLTDTIMWIWLNLIDFIWLRDKNITVGKKETF